MNDLRNDPGILYDAIEWPKTLPTPLLRATTEPSNTFIKTQFDHGVRYRKSYCSVYLLDYEWVFTPLEMKIFRSWYYNDLLNGVRYFTADWIIEASDKIPKIFHFFDKYTIVTENRTGCNYRMRAKLELVTNINEIDGFMETGV